MNNETERMNGPAKIENKNNSPAPEQTPPPPVNQKTLEKPEDFRKKAQLLLNDMMERKESAETGYLYTFGQKSGTTSKGVPLTIDTVSWFTEGDWMAPENTQRIAFVAKNPENKIVGLRMAFLTKDPNSSMLSGDQLSKGMIVTRERGTGVSTVIDSALVEVLQGIMNEYGIENPTAKLTWEVKNKNLENLERQRADGQLSEEEEKKLLSEQKRWASQYGNSAKFGLEESGHDPKVLKREFAKGEGKEELLQKINMGKYEELIEQLQEAV